MSELKTIRLYGQMGARFGRVHRFAVENTGEAVQALCTQIPGFERYLNESKEEGYNFAVFVGKKNLSEGNLHDPVGEEDIRFAPIAVGSKRGGILQTIVGIVLIVIGCVFPPAAAYTIPAGIGMVAGGVIQMLTPLPKSGSVDTKDANASYLFNGPVNTQAQGNPVPLVYGRLIVGSAVISASIKANQEQVAGTSHRDRVTSGGGFWSDRMEYLSEQ